MVWEIFDIKNWIFSKINRKITFLFIIVGLIAPIIAVYYFYIIALGAIPPEILLEQAELLQTVMILMIIIIAVNAGVVGYFVSRSISKPIQALHHATKKVSKGKYDVRLEINTGDEMEELAHSFNNTTVALAKIEQEKKEIDKAKSEFLSITSHELRSPMTPMKAQLQMLEEGYFGKLKKEQKESLHIVIRNADRLDRIISDFLEISRIEAARLKFVFNETDIKQTIIETVKLMAGFAKEKRITLETHIGKLPVIEVDSDRISQVLGNLVNNAIKFSPKQGKIIVSAAAKEDHILFSIQDYGVGLSTVDQIKIFEPFYQVEDTSRRRWGGTGLGLAICRVIVESQKGKIWVESKVGSGSKFSFTVPLIPVRRIEPIKVLFSEKNIIDRKVCEEFRSTLGPLGVVEFNELRNKNAINKEDIKDYIDVLIDNYILDNDRGIYFKHKIGEIFGDKKGVINEKVDIPSGIDRMLLVK